MDTVTPEFSRVVREEAMAGGEVVREIEAKAEERQALAVRLKLVAINQLKATVRLWRLDGSRKVRVRGRLWADVVQSCVVSLEPVPAQVDEEFGALFAPLSLIEAERADGVLGDLVLDPFAIDEDLPEPIAEGGIDIGELTAQHLSLALDPYPRRPGVVFAGFDDDGAEAEAEAKNATNPFRALARVKASDPS